MRKRPEPREEHEQTRHRHRGPFGVLHRKGLGRDLGEREDHDDLEQDADARRPAAPNVGSSTVPSNVAEIIWHASTSEQDAVQRLLRMLEQAQQRVRRACRLRRRGSSTGYGSTRTNAVSAEREHRRQRDEHDDRRDRRTVLRRSPWPQDLCSSSRKRARSSCSRRRITARLARFGVVVVEQVQHTVDHEQRELVFGAAHPAPTPGGSRPPGTPRRRRAASADRSDPTAYPARGRPGRAGGPTAAARRRSGTRARRSGRSTRGSAR